MVNIPLTFWQMELIMLFGILSNILWRINKINHETPEFITPGKVWTKFMMKEWASYSMSLIFTGMVSYSFHYIKQFQKVDNAEISYWAKWVPAAVIILYFFAVLNQAIFYWALGKIQKKGNINTDMLTDKPKE